MEYWNHGFWDNGMVGLENQNDYSRIDLFPLLIPSIPTFHYSIIPGGFPIWMAKKNTIFPKSCRNSDTLN
jgi:hypothetical protein